jgi:hypothetical protein
MTEEYYVYAYLREDGTPYYIGKGKDQRAYKPHNGLGIPPRDRIQIVYSNLNEDVAYSLEKMLIAKYGRLNNGTGILRNKSDGGDSNNGIVNVKWINDGQNEKRISPKDATPEGWKEGRLWTLNDYFFINNGSKSKAILKTRSIPRGWTKGRIGSNTADLIFISDGVENKLIKKTDVIPEGWNKGFSYRHNKEQLKRIADANREWRWITDGVNNKRIHQSNSIPKGWCRGRTDGIKVKYSGELIETIIEEYKCGATKSALQQKYNINRSRIRKIIETPDAYKVG